MQLVTIKENKKYYLSKNNNNVLRLSSLSEYFNDSLFLVMFRDPLNQANSLMKQNNLFRESQKHNKFILEYMNMIGHFEFGINRKNVKFDHLSNYKDTEIEYWIEYWIYLYEFVLSKKKGNIEFICYEELCINASKYLNYKFQNFKKFQSNFSIDKLLNKNKSVNCFDKKLVDRSYEIYKQLKST